MPPPTEFRVDTVWVDLPAVAGAFGRRLYDAGLPVTSEHARRFAVALDVVRPVSRRRLYWTARSAFVSDQSELKAFNAVFASVFGGTGLGRDPEGSPNSQGADSAPAPADDRPVVEGSAGGALSSSSPASDRSPAESDDAPVPMFASDEEVLRRKQFDALEPHELAALYELMKRLQIATPLRRTRRAVRYRHGERIDLRRTLRGSMHTAGDPVRLMRRRRRLLPRRIVLLCDISGSMEPYARAYLQFLTCAAGAGPRAEAFVFATRLTRVTRALRSRSPERALRNAAAAAPDWSSGTRIGDALKEFNDRHGRRGMARGAVVVILSDGWERGDPAVVAREMERLSRLAHRIVWVNPRLGSAGFVPRAGGMVAALPFCDALVSGHSLDALGEVVEAIRGSVTPAPVVPAAPLADDEPWASATPMPGSSVAMPSGYGPSRGRTTPGWES